MLAISQFYQKTKLPLDVIFLSIIFQPVIVTEWLAFKKLLFNDRNRFFGTVIGLAAFIFLLFFCYKAQRTKAAQALKKLFPHVNWTTPTFADAIRFIIQALWLMTVQTQTAYDVFLFNLNFIYRLLTIIKYIVILPFTGISKTISVILSKIQRSNESYNMKFEPYVYVLFIFLLVGVCITVPFNISAQVSFILLLWLIVMIVRSIAGYLPKVALVTLSIIVSSRYLWWRYTSTLNIGDNIDVFLGVILICAETYTWLVLLLGFLQMAWPLQRKPVSLPADSRLWPSVDIFIPTYQEELSIIRTTILAALNIDWPEDKVNIFILDDGKRSSIQEFATQINVGYITRDNNLHAKAGNINQALTVTKGDYVTIFDCGHIPVRSFLQLTMGWFLEDKNLALIQTPHHSYSPDLFARNPGSFKTMPDENSLFYGMVQSDDASWNEAFFSGSCAVLKRSALLEVGGIAVETITEAAHTALRLQRKGYSSAYINVIQASGLVPETLPQHIGKRIRWARGMAQIFRIENPLLATRLNIAQRLCYANAMLHFLNGIPRLIFLLAPLGFLFFHSYLIYAPAVEIVLYALPVIVLSNIAKSYIQQKQRYSFWVGIYEAVLEWYITAVAAIALINPKNVNATGGSFEAGIFDLARFKPYVCLIALNLSAAVFALARYLFGPANEQAMVVLNFAWAACNLMILGIAIGVTQESKQMRLQRRIKASTEVIIKKASGHLICALMEDYSDSGLGLCIDAKLAAIEKNEKIYVLISRYDREFVFPARVIDVNQGCFDVLFENLTLQQQLDYIQCTYSRSDAWLSSRQHFPLSSIKTIIMTGLYGYIVLVRPLPKFITRHFLLLSSFMVFIKTLLPKNIKDNSIQHEHA